MASDSYTGKSYFHVDRLCRLSSGQIITSSKEATDHQTPRAQMMQDLFPNGVSRHGVEYFIESGHAQPNADTNGMIEMIAELMRRLKYPQRPSRFQSLFAWQTLEDAHRFAGPSKLPRPDNANPAFAVWEVDTMGPGETFASDMKLLSLGACWLDAFIHIDAYWHQDYSSDPFVEVLLPLPVRVIRQVTM